MRKPPDLTTRTRDHISTKHLDVLRETSAEAILAVLLRPYHVEVETTWRGCVARRRRRIYGKAVTTAPFLRILVDDDLGEVLTIQNQWNDPRERDPVKLGRLHQFGSGVSATSG